MVTFHLGAELKPPGEACPSALKWRSPECSPAALRPQHALHPQAHGAHLVPGRSCLLAFICHMAAGHSSVRFKCVSIGSV